MGKLKFVLIVLTVVSIGTVGGAFMMLNDSSAVTIDLLFAGPFTLPLGRLMLYCFFMGILLGVFFCVAYVMVQSLELLQSRKLAASYKQQLDNLRSTSLKDTL